MQFREFFQVYDAVGRVGDVSISIRQVPLAPHEAMLLESADANLLNIITNTLTNLAKGVRGLYTHDDAAPERSLPNVEVLPTRNPSLMDDERMKKFRVSLRYPRTMKGHRLGHYLPEMLYLYAKDAKDAKKKAEEYVRTKLEPTENDETRRYPKKNYLRDVESGHLDAKAKQVKTWGDLVQSLADLSRKRGLYIWDSFDENDLRIILLRATRKSFAADLNSLSPKQMRLLKKVYFTLAQDPHLSFSTMKMLDPEVDAKIKRAKGEGEQPETPGAPKLPHGWDYWSINEPKSDEEERMLLTSLEKVSDVIKVGMRYGVPPSHLRAMALEVEEYDTDNKNVAEERQLYDDLMRSVRKQMAKHRQRMALQWKYYPQDRAIIKWQDIIEEDDPDSKLMRKAGISWGTIMEIATQGEYHNASSLLHVGYSDDVDPNSSVKQGEAEDYVWGLLRRGRPYLKPKVEYFKTALDRLINQRHKALKPHPEPEEDIDVSHIPF